MPTIKYLPLQKYLEKSEKNTEVLTFSEIEKLIGDKLPVTAYNRHEWWSNNKNHHSQASAWLDPGWKTETVTLGKSITFRKE